MIDKIFVFLKKRYYVSYFTGMTKVKSFNISVLFIYGSIALASISVIVNILFIISYQKNKNIISEQNTYIIQLKKKIMPQILKELVKTSDLNISVTNNDSQKIISIIPKKTSTIIPVITPTVIISPKNKVNYNLKFNQITILKNNDGVNVSLVLLNQDTNIDFFIGNICLIAELENNKVTSPTSFAINDNFNEQTCENGLYVKFSKVRPVTFKLIADNPKIKTLKFIFNDTNLQQNFYYIYNVIN